MSLTLYGISNCDTVKRARKALEAAGTDFQFHDFRKDGLEEEAVNAMLSSLGADALLNKRGTTWRGLSEDDKARGEGDGLAGLLVQYPALIKRPVWEKSGDYRLGFAAKDSDETLAWAAS